MPRKTQQRTLKTRKQILDAAREVFDEFGYADASMEEIARRAGVAKGTVFAHFGDKVGLITNFLVAELAAISMSDVPAVETPPAEAMVRLVHPFVSLLSSERILLQIYLERVGVTDETCSQEFMAELHRLQHVLIQVITMWQKADRIRTDKDPEFLVSGIVAFVTQAVSMRQCGNIPTDEDQLRILEEQFSAWLL